MTYECNQKQHMTKENIMLEHTFDRHEAKQNTFHTSLVGTPIVQHLWKTVCQLPMILHFHTTYSPNPAVPPREMKIYVHPKTCI